MVQQTLSCTKCKIWPLGLCPTSQECISSELFEVLSCQSFPLIFPICPKLVSDPYKDAAELLQIAAWGFTENPAWYYSLNAPAHELPLHSLCFMDPNQGVCFTITGAFGDPEPEYGWKFVLILNCTTSNFAISATLLITKPLLCYLNGYQRGFFIYMLIELFLPKGILQRHFATGWIRW